MSVSCSCPGNRFPLTRASRKAPKQEYQTLIELPQYQAAVTNHALRTHVPEFYAKARQLGSRRVYPMAHIGHLFSNFSQVSDHELAVNWIFLRVAHYHPRQCQYHPAPPVPIAEDPIEVLLQSVTNATMFGDEVTADAELEHALKIFWTVGYLLQSREFGHSHQMLDAYFQTALGFVAPLISAMTLADPMYCLVGGIVLASDGNAATVQNLVMFFPLQHRMAFEAFLIPLVQMGDLMAYQIFQLMLKQ